MNSQRSDYNKHTNLPFVYQLTSPEYHEPIKDQDVKNNYNPNSSEWVDANYPRMSMYNDAKVNVLEEALPFQLDHMRKGIERERRNPKEVMILWIQPSQHKLFPKYVLSIKLQDMESQNVHRLILK